MLRRLVSVLVMVVLVAPAIALCAGTVSAPRASANHGCCPREMAASAESPVAPAMNESCCAMSDEAGQRVPSPTSQSVTAPQPAAVLPAWARPVSFNAPALHFTTAPPSPDHIPRHLLLSVLIV